MQWVGSLCCAVLGAGLSRSLARDRHTAHRTEGQEGEEGEGQSAEGAETRRENTGGQRGDDH